jgi:hypothetical protein
MEEIMSPKSWEEFRREYRAGRCKISFEPTKTRPWADAQGWIKTKPYVIGYSLMATVVAVGGLWLIGRFITIPIKGYLTTLLLAVLIGASVGWIKAGKKCFIAKIMSSEAAFWLAYKESGMDIYRIN